MGIEIHSATHEDAAVCVLLRASAISHQPPGIWTNEQLCRAVYHFGLEQMQAEMHKPGAQFWLASLNGRALGFAGLDNRYLRFLFMHPIAQGQGIGRMLLDQVEDYARQQGIKEITLESHPYAEAFYKQRGYVAGAASVAPYDAPLRWYSKALAHLL